MGALPESQVKSFIERLVGPVGPSPVEEILTEADALSAAGDLAGAAGLYAAVLKQDAANLAALAGLARTHLALGDAKTARAILAQVPPDKQDDARIAAARAAIEVAERAAAVGDTAALEARVSANPADHQARFGLALGLAAAGDRDAAIDHLVEIIKRDRTWNEDGARKQLVQFFDAWGPVDEATVAGRRKLSAVLFR
jgi:putative thioredoxin